MESPEEFNEIGCKEQNIIVKGKRTKRPRPQSPINFIGDDTDAAKAASSSENVSSSLTEEEEDMANCLILLAQGHGQFREIQNQSPTPDDFDHAGAIYHKFNSRRFMEAPAAAPDGGKAGYYVYECKTCNRTFPSFQALGGHRASHKKPKLEENRRFSDEEEGNWPQFVKNSNFSLQLSNNRGGLFNANRGKVHECSICGAEFNSGQALGGHMRRHRGPLGGGSSSTVLSLKSTTVVMETEQPKQRSNVVSLNLDLNLPAPEECENRETKLSFSSKQQTKPQQSQQQQQQKPPPSLVFSSAPALVGCQY